MYYKSSEEETIKPHREGFSHSPFSSLSNHNVALGFDLDQDKATSDEPSKTTGKQL